MRCALVHDWLTGMRGGEKVLEILCELFPDSDLYTVIHTSGSCSERIEKRKIVSSPLSALPGVRRYYRYLLPLMPWAAGRLHLHGYDLVVAVSHCVAHGVDVSPGTRFVCYCNSPMRYAWNTIEGYFPRGRRLDPRYWALQAVRGKLQEWDRRAAGRVTEYIGNSRNVAGRIEACYGRKAAVIYPPVDTDFFHPVGGTPGDYYLWVGALAPYKRIDLAADAFRQLDRRLVVIGDGQHLKRARRMAPKNVQFLGRQPDAVLREHYSRCRALVFPGEEDFGIVPLEAQACGRPVIAYGRGGALETVTGSTRRTADTGATGVFFPDPTAQSLAAAIREFESGQDAFDPDACRSNAMRFSRERCKRELAGLLSGETSLASRKR